MQFNSIDTSVSGQPTVSRPCSGLPAGKSSLMKILAGVDTNFEGRVQLSPGIRIGFLEQEPELKDGERCGGQRGWSVGSDWRESGSLKIGLAMLPALRPRWSC